MSQRFSGESLECGDNSEQVLSSLQGATQLIYMFVCVCRSAECGRTCPSRSCDSCKPNRCASACPRRRAGATRWRGRSSNTELCLLVRIERGMFYHLETFRFSDRVDKKESQYLQITGSVYHSHVTLKSLARINVAERSGVCLGGVCGENTPILNMVMLSVRRDVQLNADIGGGELGHGRHRYADAE